MQRIFLVVSVLLGTLFVSFLTLVSSVQWESIAKMVKVPESAPIVEHNVPVVVSPSRIVPRARSTGGEYSKPSEQKSKLAAFPPPREVSTPGPLIVAPTSFTRQTASSSPSGSFPKSSIGTTEEKPLAQGAIMLFTNTERTKAGLPPLSWSDRLAKMAEAKALDMIAKQYFAHVSPDGTDLTALANKYGYQFFNVGENLALGDFSGSADVVSAWMNSPGHRENILNTHFTEIGVAALEGTHNGRLVWYAVQEFGRPFPPCAKPEPLLKEQVGIYQNELVALEATLKNLEIDINTSSEDLTVIAQKVKDYNTIVALHNDLVASTTAAVDLYNKEAHAFNVCAGLE